jgi:uncharacterized protein YecE (DUF72 family)
MTIRTGIGGWTFPPWRGGAFYPAGLAQREELAFASRALGAIEVNATFHRLQKPQSFANWRDAAPDGFVFAVKGSRFVTNRKVLATAGESIATFFKQGVTELGDKLGPVAWQLARTKRFEPDDVSAFFALLPREHDGIALRHAIEVGHESFACGEFVALAREARVAVIWLEDETSTPIADRTADFAYLRLKRMESGCATGYPPAGLDRIAGMCRAWAAGEAPAGLPYAGGRGDSAGHPGDVFAFCINGAKERAPAAAQALAARVGEGT